MMINIYQDIIDSQNELVQIRRHLHKTPELAFEEIETQKYIMNFLASCGIESKKVAGTGVLAEIQGEKGDSDKIIALRADMDALPIQDKKTTDYASSVDGKMHACGHDGHVAMLLIAGKIINQNKANFSGTVRLIFQPAEEKGPGAKKMIAEGAIESVDKILGLHLWNTIPTGSISVNKGPVTAFTGRFNIFLQGRSFHAAFPHKGIDALVAANSIFQAIQTIKNKDINPNESSIISVGRLVSGTSHNIVPSNAELNGIVRCYSREVRDVIFNRIREIVEAQEVMYSVKTKCETIEGSDAIINDDEISKLISDLFLAMPFSGQIVNEPRSAIGEDFSEYLKYCPGVMVFVGSMADDGTILAQHGEMFDINEKALVIGTCIHVGFILNQLA